LEKLRTEEKHHILQELLIGFIVFLIYVAALIIHDLKTAFRIVDIIAITAVGMIFGVVIQGFMKKVLNRM
jgi:glucose uptake protein GlcU